MKVTERLPITNNGTKWEERYNCDGKPDVYIVYSKINYKEVNLNFCGIKIVLKVAVNNGYYFNIGDQVQKSKDNAALLETPVEIRKQRAPTLRNIVADMFGNLARRMRIKQ